MDKYIYDKSNGLWGQRHKRYLQEHKRVVYTTLLTSAKNSSYLYCENKGIIVLDKRPKSDYNKSENRHLLLIDKGRTYEKR